MKENQNTTDAIDHKRAIRINSGSFLTFSSVADKNWPFSRGYWKSGTCVSGRLLCLSKRAGAQESYSFS